MTETEREAFYDREIAPVLLDLCVRCNQAGLSFLAAVEWAPGQTGRTRSFVEHIGLPLEIADAALVAGPDLDALLRHVKRLGKERGHASPLLAQLNLLPGPGGTI